MRPPPDDHGRYVAAICGAHVRDDEARTDIGVVPRRSARLSTGRESSIVAN